MARVGVTKAEVFEAADHLKQQERQVTVLAVRELLGRGSNSTINPYLQEWKSQNVDGMDRLELPEVPEALRRSLSYSLQNLWKEALAEAGKIYQQRIDELERINQELEGKLVKAQLSVQAKSTRKKPRSGVVRTEVRLNRIQSSKKKSTAKRKK